MAVNRQWVCLLCLLLSASAIAQERQGGVRVAMGVGGSFRSDGTYTFGPSAHMPPHLFRMLVDKSISSEIGMSEEQISALRKFIDDYQSKMVELINRARAAGFNARLEDQPNIFDQCEAFMKELLLPSQLDRLRQLTYQVEVSRVGFGYALADGNLGVDAGVTENQKTFLLQKAEEIEAELQRDILRLRIVAQQRVLQKLTEVQRAKATALLGKPFEFVDDQFTKPRRDKVALMKVRANKEP